jgi:hypothetical protein
MPCVRLHASSACAVRRSRVLATGDISALLKMLEPSKSLRSLSIEGTALGGTLPAKCAKTSILSRIVELRISGSAVGGAVPDCISGLTAFHLTGTRVGGPLPPFPTSSKLQFLSLKQVRMHASLQWVLMHCPAAPRVAARAHARLRGRSCGALRLHGHSCILLRHKV